MSVSEEALAAHTADAPMFRRQPVRAEEPRCHHGTVRI